MTLDVSDLSRLKVKDLQRELKKRGLDTSGLKAVLLLRLKEYLQQEEADAPAEAEAEAEPERQDQEKELEEVAKEKVEDDKSDGKRDEQVSGSEGDHSGSGTEQEVSVELVPGEPVKTKVAHEKDGEPDAKKRKLDDEVDKNSSQPEDEDNDKLTSPADPEDNEKAVEPTEDQQIKTLRIDNFVRPFTLNAVKALVQEFGDFVEDGFWMDVIKTHCFVTYPEAEIAKKTGAALDGKIWPPENGRALHVAFVEQTAMEVSEHGESSKVSIRSKSKGNSEAPSNQRKKVTIDEFFLKTETKPVLYYLPLTDEQVQQRKQRQAQEGQPRNKRRHRGGRKNRNRGRFQRR
ncbi:hypothetical protein BBJ29_003362 [Phytophthora kernoviae]|uniref:SAP domain-containing protein n=1 Tax=Phytophthora kernoviae TaxID=325452 RepID=A0A3F2RVC8_9STRA|nr:hypothetical protein BBJ29_003362 [Phytophthora kernoviae]RLN64915.1 hypothetical protein BBP00_00003145 [Phytophthora kernoviae]